MTLPTFKADRQQSRVQSSGKRVSISRTIFDNLSLQEGDPIKVVFLNHNYVYETRVESHEIPLKKDILAACPNLKPNSPVDIIIVKCDKVA